MGSHKKESKKRKRRHRIRCILQGTLLLSGMLLVIFICVGEVRSLLERRQEGRERTEMAMDTRGSDRADTSPAEAAEGRKEADPETGESVESEMETASSLLPQRDTEEGSAEDPLTDQEKLEEIQRNRLRYPEKILGMLDKNRETLDFVYEYPQKQGQVYGYALTREDMAGQGIPLLIQWDQRWGYGSYGDGLVATNGCGPACLAMVIAGLTGNTQITPYVMAVKSYKNGYLDGEGNTMWSFIAEGGREFGVLGQAISLDREIVMDTLKQGFPIICSVRPGDFTDGGHFIVLAGCEDGEIKVNDPYSYANSVRLWELETLLPQIKNLWKMYPAENEEEAGGTFQNREAINPCELF